MDSKNQKKNVEEWKQETQRREREERIAAMKTADGDKKPIKNRKTATSIIFPVIACVLIIAVLAWGTFALGLPQKFISPMKVGSRSVSALEYSYFYNSTYQQYLQYAKRGIIARGSNGQFDMNALTGIPEYENLTWGEYLDSVVQKQIQRLEILLAGAEAKGVTLSAQNKLKLDKQFDQLVKNYGNLNDVENELVKVYGRGVTVDGLRKIVGKIMLAEQYAVSLPDTIDVPASDVEKYYKEHESEFKQATYRNFVFALPEPSEEDKKAAPGVLQKKQAENMSKMKESVDMFKAAVKTEQDFINQAKKFAKEKDKAAYDDAKKTLRSNVPSSSIGNKQISDWLMAPERKAGDIEVFAGPNNYQVIYFLKADKDTNKYPAVGRILFSMKTDSEKKSAQDLEAKKKAQEALVATAEKVLPEIKDKDSLEAVGSKLAEDGENAKAYWIQQQTTAKLDHALAAWIDDPARKPGDKTVIKTEKGCEILFYGEKGTKEAWYVAAEQVIKSERLKEDIEKKANDAQYKVHISKIGMCFVDKLAKNTKTGAEIIEASKAAATAENNAKPSVMPSASAANPASDGAAKASSTAAGGNN